MFTFGELQALCEDPDSNTELSEDNVKSAFQVASVWKSRRGPEIIIYHMCDIEGREKVHVERT